MEMCRGACLERGVQDADDHRFSRVHSIGDVRACREGRVEPLGSPVPSVNGFGVPAATDRAWKAELRLERRLRDCERLARWIREHVQFEEADLRVDPGVNAEDAVKGCDGRRKLQVTLCLVVASSAACGGDPASCGTNDCAQRIAPTEGIVRDCAQ